MMDVKMILINASPALVTLGLWLFLPRLLKPRVKPVEEKYVRFQTADTYLAAWLIQNGAKVDSVGLRHNPDKKGLRSKSWKFHLNNVPVSALERWKKRQAIGDIREYAKTRASLKVMAKEGGESR